VDVDDRRCAAEETVDRIPRPDGSAAVVERPAGLETDYFRRSVAADAAVEVGATDWDTASGKAKRLKQNNATQGVRLSERTHRRVAEHRATLAIPDQRRLTIESTRQEDRLSRGR